MITHPCENIKVSPLIDAALRNFLTLFLTHHVEPLCATLSTDAGCLTEIKKALRYTILTLIKRVQNINLALFLESKVLPILFQHYEVQFSRALLFSLCGVFRFPY